MKSNISSRLAWYSYSRKCCSGFQIQKFLFWQKMFFPLTVHFCWKCWTSLIIKTIRPLIPKYFSQIKDWNYFWGLAGWCSSQFSTSLFFRTWRKMFSGKQQCFGYKNYVKIFTWAGWFFFCYCHQYYYKMQSQRSRVHMQVSLSAAWALVYPGTQLWHFNDLCSSQYRGRHDHLHK